MKGYMKKIRKIKDSNEMVSEILGTVLLIGIVVAIFSTMYVSVVSHPNPEPSSYAHLVATIEGNNIIIEHRGGDALSLNTKLQITIGNKITNLTIGEKSYLDNESKKDKLWNLGERVVFPFEYNLSYCEAQISAVDRNSNSLIMMGSLDITPESDVGLKVTVDNEFPKILDYVTFTITVTNYRGDLDYTGVIVQYILPKGLTYKSSYSTQGTYDKSTGNWNVGELEVCKSGTLTITAEVIGEPSQLAILLDGSGSISDSSWKIMRNGLANAINDPNIFPHSGAVELTIIQYGVQNPKNKDEYCAKLEVGPEIVTKNNYQYIVNQIYRINQGKGLTPMAAGIYLAGDTFASSKNFGGYNSDNRQIINIVTDGNPTVASGPGELCGKFDNDSYFEKGKKSAKEARDYLLSTLTMTEDQDEIDAVAVETCGEVPIDIEWLKDEIAWPQPGYTSWYPEGPGWVHHVKSWQEFVDSIEEQFKLLFRNTITSNMKITFTTLRDPNEENNQVSITIMTKK
jgi:uncharacterized repeat protein (TIGR01451 family)